MRSAKCTHIDVSANFLPFTNNSSGYLLMPTKYWKKYISDHPDVFPTCEDAYIGDVAPEYIEAWTKRVTWLLLNSPVHRVEIGHFTMADILLNLHKYWLGNELDENNSKIIREVFSKK